MIVESGSNRMYNSPRRFFAGIGVKFLMDKARETLGSINKGVPIWATVRPGVLKSYRSQQIIEITLDTGFRSYARVTSTRGARQDDPLNPNRRISSLESFSTQPHISSNVFKDLS